MATTIKNLVGWLKQFKEDDVVGIDSGGLTLEIAHKNGIYYEIGGVGELGMPNESMDSK